MRTATKERKTGTGSVNSGYHRDFLSAETPHAQRLLRCIKAMSRLKQDAIYCKRASQSGVLMKWKMGRGGRGKILTAIGGGGGLPPPKWWGP